MKLNFVFSSEANANTRKPTAEEQFVTDTNSIEEKEREREKDRNSELINTGVDSI